jgi:hypothetical protein
MKQILIAAAIVLALSYWVQHDHTKDWYGVATLPQENLWLGN